MNLNDNERLLQKKLKNWEINYQKGQIHFWILLSFREGKKSVKEVQQFIFTTTFQRIHCNEQTVYRVVRNYFLEGFIQVQHQKSTKGPDQKLYSLTDQGNKLLNQFINRNIEWLYAPTIRKWMNC